MANIAGNVEFSRVSEQLRYLFQAPNVVTTVDILHVTKAPASTPDDDLPYEARLAYRKGNKRRTGAKNAPRSSSKSSGKKHKPKKGEQEKNGFNRRTGERNRCYRRGSEYHLLPRCPMRQENKAPAQPSSPSSHPRPSFSSLTLEDTPSDQKSVERSFSTSLKADCPSFRRKMKAWSSWTLELRPSWCDFNGYATIMSCWRAAVYRRCPPTRLTRRSNLAKEGLEAFAMPLTSPRARPALGACSRLPYWTRIFPRS